jgi:DNA-binding NarL/FixJ family response regulator
MSGLVVQVFVVSGASLYREALCDLLERRPRIAVVGDAGGPAEAARTIVCAGLEPDVVVLDMAGAGGVAGARRLLTDVPGARLLAITAPQSESAVVACAEAGVSGFITSDACADDLVAAIEHVVDGRVVCSPALTGALIRRIGELSRRRDGVDAGSGLTAREREILTLIEHGLTNKAIAARLCIELPTVKNHVHNILEKLGVRGRAEAAALMRAGASASAP